MSDEEELQSLKSRSQSMKIMRENIVDRMSDDIDQVDAQIAALEEKTKEPVDLSVEVEILRHERATYRQALITAINATDGYALPESSELSLSLGGSIGIPAYIAKLKASVEHAEAAKLPEELTPAMRDALSLMLWESGPIAHLFRANGATIKTKAKDEQTHVLFWALKLAIQHRDKWRTVAREEIETIRASLTESAKE